MRTLVARDDGHGRVRGARAPARLARHPHRPARSGGSSRVAAALPLVLPSFVAALALVAAFAQGGLLEELFGIDTQLRIEGFWAAFTVLTVISYPYVYLPGRGAALGLPRSLEESARSLGRSPASVFRTVVLPQARGAILAGSLLVFLYVVSEFGAVALLHYDTLTRRIYSARLLDPTAAMAMSLLLGLVALVGRDRRARRRPSSPPHRGDRWRRPPAPDRSSGRWKVPGRPRARRRCSRSASSSRSRCSSHWAWRGIAGGRNVLGRSADPGSLVGPTLNTALLGIAAALVAVVLVLPVAYLTARYRSRIGGVANALVVAGFALPGLVIALVARVVDAAVADPRPAVPDAAAADLRLRRALRRAGDARVAGRGRRRAAARRGRGAGARRGTVAALPHDRPADHAARARRRRRARAALDR